jgi:hypothetical protein
MQKIPTLFVRDETVKGHPVTPVVKPECQWVLDGEGRATGKFDGTNVRIRGGVLEKRQKPAVGDYDEASYVPCDRAHPADRWMFEAFDRLVEAGLLAEGIYELVGPKVQGNPHGYAGHTLLPVLPPGQVVLGPIAPERTFEGLRAYLAEAPFEGLVFHHPDGRLAKIKRRDYGLPWPPKG